VNKARRSLVPLLAFVAAALLLAACGSSKKSSSSSSSTPSSPSSSSTTSSSTQSSTSTAASTTPTGASIRIGAICDCTGPQAAQIGQEDKVIKAWAATVNAAGGLNGHPVQVTVLNANQDPGKALQDAKVLVEQNHVVAIVDYTLADAAIAKYVAQKGVPVIGGVSQDAVFLTDPDFYPTSAQLVMQTIGTFALAKEHGLKHVGVLYCAESPICAELVPLAQGAGKLNGIKVTALKVSSTAPNYTAPCLALKSAGVDGMFAAVQSAAVLRITDNCAQQGYKPTPINESTTTNNAWLKDPNLDGAILSGAGANPFDASTPAVAAFRDAMDKYYPGFTSSPQFDTDYLGNWTGGKLIEAAAKAANLSPSSTPADVKKGLYALHDETLGGLTGPLNYTPGKPAFVPCYFGLTVKNGQFQSLNGNKAICLTPAQTEALVKALHLA
jgi:branched-chain amino acid transport system substrate-binding protein